MQKIELLKENFPNAFLIFYQQNNLKRNRLEELF